MKDLESDEVDCDSVLADFKSFNEVLVRQDPDLIELLNVKVVVYETFPATPLIHSY